MAQLKVKILRGEKQVNRYLAGGWHIVDTHLYTTSHDDAAVVFVMATQAIVYPEPEDDTDA